MESLLNLLKGQDTLIEFGEIQYLVRDSVYQIAIHGVQRQAHTTLNDPLQSGDKVIVTKTVSGKRFIVAKTGFVGKYNSVKEIFIDG